MAAADILVLVQMQVLVQVQHIQWRRHLVLVQVLQHLWRRRQKALVMVTQGDFGRLGKITGLQVTYLVLANRLWVLGTLELLCEL